MKVTKHSRRDAKRLFRACQVNGRLDESRAVAVARKLGEIKPRGYAAVLTHLGRLIQLDLASRTATIESVATLTDTLREGILSNLSRLYGAELIVEFRENPALIGGLRIRVGSDVYDGSVQARLAALQESF